MLCGKKKKKAFGEFNVLTGRWLVLDRLNLTPDSLCRLMSRRQHPMLRKVVVAEVVAEAVDGVVPLALAVVAVDEVSDFIL